MVGADETFESLVPVPSGGQSHAGSHLSFRGLGGDGDATQQLEGSLELVGGATGITLELRALPEGMSESPDRLGGTHVGCD